MRKDKTKVDSKVKNFDPHEFQPRCFGDNRTDSPRKNTVSILAKEISVYVYVYVHVHCYAWVYVYFYVGLCRFIHLQTQMQIEMLMQM